MYKFGHLRLAKRKHRAEFHVQFALYQKKKETYKVIREAGTVTNIISLEQCSSIRRTSSLLTLNEMASSSRRGRFWASKSTSVTRVTHLKLYCVLRATYNQSAMTQPFKSVQFHLIILQCFVLGVS